MAILKKMQQILVFRDDAIYEYLNNLSNKNKEANKTLTLLQIDRDETIKTFNNFKNEKEDKIIY